MSKIGIVVFPGSNCDRDVYHIVKDIVEINVEYIRHTDDVISDYDAIILPGGFAYGDRLRAGIIAAYSPVMKEIKKAAENGLPILGICNGFQILVEAGILPGALITNSTLQFTCEWVKMKVVNNKTPFTSLFNKNESIEIPVAHGEGRYVIGKNSLEILEKNDQIVFKYERSNPNGSIKMIAGVCNEAGNVVGMMPHPERASEAVLFPNGIKSNAISLFYSLRNYLTHELDILKIKDLG